MAITCSRDLSIVVTAALPEPLAYYKLDSFSVLTVDDSVGSRDLTLVLVTTPPTIIPGKIGNAFQRASGVTSWRAERTNADIDLGGTDFTVRLWFRRTGTGIIMFDTYSAVDPGEHTFTLQMDVINMRVQAIIANGPGFGDSATLNTPNNSIILNQWHHLIAWHRSGVEIGMRLDNAAPVTTPFLIGLDPLATIEIDSASDLDEVSIWRGQVLTTNQQNADWNDGNGVTYPF